VLENDTDANGDVQSVVAVGLPNYGSAVVSGTTQIVYTPANRTATYAGVFTYTVSDSDLADTATVSVSVIADNDAPEADDDTDSTDEDTNATGTISASDPDTNDTLSYGITAQPAHGSAAVNPSSGAWTYTPANRRASYTVSFAVAVTDIGGLADAATITITVAADNDAPVAVNDTYTTTQGMPLTVAAPGVLDNDSDADDDDSLTAVLDSEPANGTLALNADGSITYTPAPGFGGVDTFTYHSHDGTLDSNVATVEIVVKEQAGYTVFLPLVQRSQVTTVHDGKR
jgi:VCBS repeat-containing protein